MSKTDQQEFKNLIADADSEWFPAWTPVLEALSRLTMPDMLQALAAITRNQFGTVRRWATTVLDPGDPAFKRIDFACEVVKYHIIHDYEIPLDQVNDGREFLGCTRLGDAGVQFEIDRAINQAKSDINTGKTTSDKFVTLSEAERNCCGAVFLAWDILVKRRREKKRGSLNADLAAAAHYMLARYHVCSGKAGVNQMKIVIGGYDDKKKATFESDGNLDSMALTRDNPPFPVDFAITNWACKGADDGEENRARCNGDAKVPWVFPEVDGNLR